MALVAAAAHRCAAQHQPPPGWAVQLQLETTRDEVVDVIATTAALPITACLIEALWAVRLPPTYDLMRERFTLDFH